MSVPILHFFYPPAVAAVPWRVLTCEDGLICDRHCLSGYTAAVFGSVQRWGGNKVFSIYTELKKLRDGCAAVVPSLGAVRVQKSQSFPFGVV